MKFRSIVSIHAALVALAMASLHYFFEQNLGNVLLTFFISLILSFFTFKFLFERFIIDKIKIIYKLIHSLKLGKDLKSALGVTIGDDPLNTVREEVLAWSKQKMSEIDALKDQEKFRREFLANVSHEFKTPLFVIQGYLETLQDGLLEDDPELALDFLHKVSRNIDRLSLLVQDLDAISKLESGEVPVNFKKFDVVVLIKEVIDILSHKAEESHISLDFKAKYQSPAWVYADRDKIHQVLVNLIENSIKYGKKNGQTSVKIYELFDQFLVEITDNGIGVDEKNLKRLFERFYRADKSRSREVGGSGLGLAIVKHIVEAHQQTVTVRSTEGMGSTFGFTLQKVDPPKNKNI